MDVAGKIKRNENGMEKENKGGGVRGDFCVSGLHKWVDGSIHWGRKYESMLGSGSQLICFCTY